jgi:hypothetical protein
MNIKLSEIKASLEADIKAGKLSGIQAIRIFDNAVENEEIKRIKNIFEHGV